MDERNLYSPLRAISKRFAMTMVAVLISGCSLPLSTTPREASHVIKSVNHTKLARSYSYSRSKKNKGRLTLLSEKLLIILRQYYMEYRSIEYLFEGQTGGSHSPSGISNILNKAALKSEIRKNVTPLYMLHHSFATHLLEKGTGLRYIKKLLGRES